MGSHHTADTEGYHLSESSLLLYPKLNHPCSLSHMRSLATSTNPNLVGTEGEGRCMQWQYQNEQMLTTRSRSESCP